MKDFIKLFLIAMLVCREILPSLITIGMDTQKSISSLYSYYEYKAEKTRIQQCQKIMNSALDEIDFLQDFEAKLSGTWQDLYYEND